LSLNFVNSSVWDDNLVSYYKLDETSGAVIDSVGSNDGTNNGSTQGVTGKINTAYDFDGINDYMDIPVKPTLNSFTISQWVKFDAVDKYQIICDNGWFGSTQNIILWLKNSNVLEAGVRDRGIVVTQITTTDTYTTGVWYHIVVVADGTDLILYVNNSVVASDSANINQVSTNDFKWGNTHTGTEYHLDGLIDEVNIK